ncbi:hypothetical protein RMAECT_0400 [Rickettsia rhipicephali str. Ect]|uniref:Uncharacterized protein n=1 Tax=Rickettsia rhipicephali str. Ect TaxID=1359199 RepID=A0A0F3PEC7_RICRH|nr:hypothetical protein RMAECT_0400 [Rickettsia rhipicephali str. Ect]
MYYSLLLMLLHDSKKFLTSYLSFYYDTQQNNFSRYRGGATV